MPYRGLCGTSVLSGGEPMSSAFLERHEWNRTESEHNRVHEETSMYRVCDEVSSNNVLCPGQQLSKISRASCSPMSSTVCSNVNWLLYAR